eukprot:c22031_g1_i1 orf=244-1122(+)
MLEEKMPAIAAMPLRQVPSAFVGEMNAGSPGSCRRKEDRLLQWGYHETKELIAIRAEVERDFAQTKRSKMMWVLIAMKMEEKGFRRSADQCKWKWKNLVNRYKGKEVTDAENGRQCPFFDEMDAIFKERERMKDRLVLESDAMMFDKSSKKMNGLDKLFSDEDSEDENEDEDGSDDERFSRAKKRRIDKEKPRVIPEKFRASSMQEVLENFFRQQQRVEEEWREALEMREQERRTREQEWRDAMHKLEQERFIREQAWREREEERRVREEARAEKRDELFEALVRRLGRDDN